RSKTLCKVVRKVECRSVFHAQSHKFNILAIPSVLAHGKSYEHGFVKKRNSHKLYAKLRGKSSFNRFSCTITKIQNTCHSQRISPWEVPQAWFGEKTR
ncbi:hypothetical protein B296_00026251, partial [Ensete ventricosum]